MCGIAGFAQASAAAHSLSIEEGADLVHRMCQAVRHRGPDDAGVMIEPAVGLGMRRLSIIDLSTGHQPIHNEDRTVSIVFNGEIYNFRELRRELETAGHRFATSSDTEAIVHAYEQWGTNAVARLRGMFGFAIWDRRTRTLLLARDRAGIKPLYYAVVGTRLYFASELKSILCARDIDRTIDFDALNHYLSFLYTPPDGSIFRSVRKLPPGHVLTWADGVSRERTYWQWPDDESFTGTEDEAADALRSTLADAVKSHLVSDVPLGAFLSGGLDSSVVVALMSEAGGARVRTFSIGFDEPEFDELDHARRVADYFGTDHHEAVVRPDAVGMLDRLVSHFDEPFADSSAIPTWYVSEMARRHVTVVLSGDGGDELFGGYDRYAPHPRVAAFDRYGSEGLRRAAAIAAAALPHGTRGKNFLRHVGRDARGRYIDAIRSFGTDEKAALLSPEVCDRLTGPDPEAQLGRRFERYARLPWSTQMMRVDAETYLPEDVLTKVDRMSMAHSLESRVPLLDNEVIALASSFPSWMKIRGSSRKHILKMVAERLLPRELLDRPKHGFAVPLAGWLRGNLRELFADTLLSGSSASRGYFQPRFVRRIVDEHLSGRRDHQLRLWLLVVLERWHQLYIDAPRRGIALPFCAPDALLHVGAPEPAFRRPAARAASVSGGMPSG